MLNGIAIREAAYLEFDDGITAADRHKRLRIAASAVVDFLCADHKVCRAKVFSGWRSPKAVLVRRIAFCALRRAGYEPAEIQRVFGCDLTTVLRSEDIERDPPPVLEQLKALILDPPPLGKDAPMAPLPDGNHPQSLPAMRRRYRRLLMEMTGSDHRRACELWRAWCRFEYPHSWKGTVLVLPREYRLRFPDRLADQETPANRTETGGSISTGGPVQLSGQDGMGLLDEASGGDCTSGGLQGNAQAA